MTLTPQNDKELICLTNCFAARLSWKRKSEGACDTQISVNKRTRSGRDSVVMIVVIEIIYTSKALFNVNGLKLFSKSRAVAENVWHSLSTLLWNVTSDVEENLKCIHTVSTTPKIYLVLQNVEAIWHALSFLWKITISAASQKLTPKFGQHLNPGIILTNSSFISSGIQ